MRRDNIIQEIEKNKIIAIVRGFEPEQCMLLARALYAGGINLIEITFNQKSPENFAKTTEAIRLVRESMQGKVFVGAGTVLTKEQVDMARDAGAEYIISPDANQEIIKYTKELGLVSMPGAMTPSEIVQAHMAGADFVKVFPVSNLGSNYIKALMGPLSHIKMLAVGGVSPDNIGEFLAAGACGAGVGGLLTNKAYIENDEFDKITRIAEEYVKHAGNCI